MKSLAIIGSTGSIGISTINVLKKNNKKFRLYYLSCDKNYNLLTKQIKKFKPRYFHINNSKYHKKFKNKKNFKSIDFFIKKKIKIDYIISAVSGYESIYLNFKLLKIAKNLLIANKETIICGGKIFMHAAKKNRCNIRPIDSEHFCINYFLNKFKCDFSEIKKIVLMASGGPFLNKKRLYNEKLSNVLKHPNWKMGKKITVDSSTMANKVLEIFEAKVLFNIPDHKIDVKIESKSLVHSIITLKNNLNFLISHNPKMEIPISNSLNCNNKFSFKLKKNSFSIESVNLKKFPLVKLGFTILKHGHAGMIIFTVLNERLVNLFLKTKIPYGYIDKCLLKIFKKNTIVKISNKCIKNILDIQKIINFAKNVNI